MAVYKVPQDVEADDKLIGPFGTRQIIYLFIAAGLIGIAYLLFQIFPLLSAIPIPFILFLIVLSFPKKEQPMEVYIAALINFYLKPNKHFWNPGQRESTIQITAPKKIEGPKIRTISEEEANHRLSFLADIVDSNGHSIKEGWAGSVQDEYIAEAAATPDMFENYDSQVITNRIQSNADTKHDEAIAKMKAAITEIEGSSSSVYQSTPTAPTINTRVIQPTSTSINKQTFTQNIQPQQSNPANTQNYQYLSSNQQTSINSQQQVPSIQVPQTQQQKSPQSSNQAYVSRIQQLSNNNAYTIETIAKEANRIQNDNNETYISLH